MAIIQGVQSRAAGRESLFHYFTVLSNIFSAVGAAFMIPYAVEGIRRKRFVLPRWVVLFQYCGALGVFITLTSAVMFILPVSGIKYGPRACAEFSSVAPDGDPGGERGFFGKRCVRTSHERKSLTRGTCDGETRHCEILKNIYRGKKTPRRETGFNQDPYCRPSGTAA